jgi:O-antigen ligase/ABC-type amino acid transport substrate-binding protein
VTTALHHALLLASAGLVIVVARRSIGGAIVITFAALVAANSSFSQVKSAFLEARWGAIVSLAVILALSLRRLDRSSLRALLPLLVLPALGLASALWSVDPRLTVARVASFGLLLAIGGGLAARAVRDRRELDGVVDWLSVLAGAMLVASLLAVATSRGVANGELRGVFENANGLGLFLGLTYPFVAASLERRHRERASLLALLAFGVIDVLSASRSGIVALLVGVVVYELARGRRGRVLAGVGVVAVASVALLVVHPMLRGNGITGSSSSPIVSISAPDAVGGAPGTTQTWASRITGARSEAWSATIDFVRDRPLTGFGFGTGDRIFARYPERVHFRYFEGANPNNGYLQLLLELGVLGLIAVVFPFGAALRRAEAIARGGADPINSALAATFVALLSVAVVESVFEAAGAPWAPLIWLCTALLLVSDPSRRPVTDPALQTWRPSPRTLRVSLAVLALGAAGIAAVLGFGRRDHVPVTSPAAAAATIAHEKCSTKSCRVAEVARVQGTVAWVRLTSPARCFIVQLKGFSGASPRARVKPATCQALPVFDAHALTVGVVESGPPYFSPPVDDPGGYEPLVVQALARRLGVGVVRWSKGRPGPPRPGVDFVLHVVVEGERVPADNVRYLDLDEELLALRGSKAAAIGTVAAARALRVGAGDDISARYASQFLRPAQPAKHYGSLDGAVSALRAHEIEGVIVDRANGAGLARASSDLVEVGLLPTHRYYVMRFPAGSRLKPLIERQVELLRLSGELERLRAAGLGAIAPLSRLR